MKRTRTPMGQVRVEFVRHGPAHNQLLSPLTPYLALCNNQSGEGFTVPIEHGEFLDLVAGIPDLQEAGAAGGRASLAQQMGIERLRAVVTTLLGGLASLRTEVARGHGTQHLRLVLSASELAALPFELADAPTHFPGAGGPLLLGEGERFVLTRETRRAHATPARWPDRPRILFASYGPEGNDVPTEAHLLALYKAVRPWTGWAGGPDGNPQDAVREFEGHLTIIRHASLRDIQEACARARETVPFTHVHVLAHGALTPDALPHRAKYGVLLRGEDGGEPEHVDGARLALALTASGPPPAVVTLASCDGGNVGSVIVGGGSVAHALHEVGVGLVVASQFPLTQAGSVVMTQVLYDGFLRGEDPRDTLLKARRALKLRLPQAIDWASLVCYASLGDDLDRELARVRATRIRKAADVVEFRARATLRRGSDPDERRRREKLLDEMARRLQGTLNEGDRYSTGRIASLLLRRFEGFVEVETEPAKLDPVVLLSLEDRRRAAEALLSPAPPTPPRSAPEGTNTHSGTGVIAVSALSPRALVEHAAAFYSRQYDDRPRELWAFAHMVFLRAALGESVIAGSFSDDEVVTLRVLATRARATRRFDMAETRMALLVARLLSPELDSLDAPALATLRASILDEAVAVMHAADEGPRGFQAFSLRRVLRRMSEWLPRRFAVARTIAEEATARCNELGVADRWSER